MKNIEIIQHNFKNEIQIVPLGDLHLGATNCMIKEIKKTIDYIANNENVYTILLGDIIDNAVICGKIPSAVYDNVMTPLQQVQFAVETLRPIKDKILGVVSGNHEFRSSKSTDINPLYLVCSELGIQNLYNDSLGIIKINLGQRHKNDGSRGVETSYTILLHHGKGTSESAIKKDHEFINQFEGVDCIVTGHTHNGRVAKFKKLVVNKYSNVVSEKDITCIVCNSFLKEAEYGLQNMLVGASNDIVYFDLKLKNKQIVCHY